MDIERPVSHSDFKERIITSRCLTLHARKRRAAFFGLTEAYVPLNNAASNERDSAHARDAPTAAKRASALFFFFFLRRIAHRERSAFTRRAQYLEDRVLPSLPSFAPFHSSSLHLRSLLSVARRSLTWPGETHTRILTRTLNRTQRSDERILQRLLYDGKGWRTAGWKYESVKGGREKEWERKKRAFTCKRSHAH